MIEIDGSYLEGGGQILRTSIALSAITKNGVHVYNIRAGRRKPGLRPQHLCGIKFASQITNGTVHGLSIGSEELTYIPRNIKGGKYLIDTRTAGAVTLILQVLAPIGIFADSPLILKIKGGTAVPFSPTIEYFRNVLCHFLKMMGCTILLDTERHGFYPAGGGKVFAKILPAELRTIELVERGKLLKIDATAISSNSLKKRNVSERLIEGFKEIFDGANTRVLYVDSISPSCFVHTQAHFEKGKLGADSLGKRGKKAEDVGKEAALSLKKEIESNAPVDRWLVDQIILYLALATYFHKMVSVLKIPCLTEHAKTNIWVIKKILPLDFEIKDSIMQITPIGIKEGQV